MTPKRSNPPAAAAALAAILLIAALVLCSPLARASSAAPRAGVAAAGEGTLTDPIDPKFLADVPFGRTSFWIQPWRAYMDTWPASRLLDAVGINFDVTPRDAEPAAQLLHDSGFKLARLSITWNALSYEDPTSLRSTNETALRTRLTALRDHGLRPLILLDSNSGDPAPSKRVTLETVQAAPAGATTVTLTPTSAAEVVPGKTGFNNLTFGGSPDVLISSVGADGLATLSRPLRKDLPAGKHGATTLLYQPFGPPKLADGQPNPAFAATLDGWLSYVATVCRLTASIVGPDGYDLEIWNELTFGSQFLNSANYYSASGEAATEKGNGVTKEVIKAVRGATVAFVRDPANGLSPAIAITDGFASQTPFPSGASAPLGMTALSKHPYVGLRSFPADYKVNSLRPVNALGVQDILPREKPPFTPLFIPAYDSLLPEYTLTATGTETLIRDLAPFTTEVYGFPHGRDVGPAGGAPVQKWITEYNISAPKELAAGLTTADKDHFHAKALLRSLVAMVSKGMSREYFFAAAPGSLSLIGEDFWSALDAHPGAYPGDGLGGEIMSGFRNMLARFQGPGPGGAARQLRLLSIVQYGDHAQFSGDGTPEHPSLYDRDVLAVFPFQSSPTRFVIPVYVMTRNVLTLYKPKARSTDVGRYDLPAEKFRIKLGNLPVTKHAPRLTAYDPLHNRLTTAKLISRDGDTGVFQLAVTDYPRILTIDYTGL